MTNGFPPYQNGYGSGGWPQNSPFSPQVPYWETPEWQEKKKIRHTSNVLGWANFAVQALMVGLSLLFSRFLLMVGYPFSGDYMSSAGHDPYHVLFAVQRCVHNSSGASILVMRALYAFTGKRNLPV